MSEHVESTVPLAFEGLMQRVWACGLCQHSVKWQRAQVTHLQCVLFRGWKQEVDGLEQHRHSGGCGSKASQSTQQTQQPHAVRE